MNFKLGSSSATCNTALGLLFSTGTLDSESAMVLAKPGLYCKCIIGRNLQMLRYHQWHQASRHFVWLPCVKYSHPQSLCDQYIALVKLFPNKCSLKYYSALTIAATLNSLLLDYFAYLLIQ